ncbi:MAG: hypothetical protein V3U54_13560, partial [Thermodesulfobacteriota bacterium]
AAKFINVYFRELNKEEILLKVVPTQEYCYCLRTCIIFFAYIDTYINICYFHFIGRLLLD